MKKTSHAHSFWVSLYSIIVLTCFMIICVPIMLSVNYIYIIISIIISISFLVLANLFLFKVLKEKHGLSSIDGPLVLLITCYIGLSLGLVALITKFSNTTLSFDGAEKMVQTSWTIFAIAISLYAIMVGLPSVIDKKENNTIKKLSINIIDTLNPILYSLLSIIIATVLLYCFYDKLPDSANSFSYVSLISTMISVPYYLLAGLRFLSKINEE